MNAFRLIAASLLLTSVAYAADQNPFPNAGAAYAKLPTVPKGGTFYTVFSGGNPKVLDPILNFDVESLQIIDRLFVKLMQQDLDTGQFFPVVAEKMTVSKDKKILTYTLRKDALWEDGTPITIDDVEFSYKTLWNEKVMASAHRAYLGPFKFEKIDQYHFRFIVETPNVNTVVNLNAEFWLVQKKNLENVSDYNTAKQTMQPVGNGAYRLKSFSRDQKIELERNKNWWGYKLPQYKNIENFDTIVYRIIPDRGLAYEKLIKRDVDLIELNSELFGTRIKGSDKDKFGDNPDSNKPLWAKHIRTDAPAPWTYIGWNLKNPLFASKATRRALAHLIDYDQIVNKVFYNEAIRSVSPFGSLSKNTDPNQKSKAIPFDVPKGIALLKQDGWADTDGDNVLDKVINGVKTKFEFTLKYNSDNPMRSKVSQMVKESFKKAGISVIVQGVEWNAVVEDQKAHRFDALCMGWGGGNIISDPKQIWYSKSYSDGSNFIGYSNPEVDKLIEDSRKELDQNKYQKIIQKIGGLIYEDQPYAFIIEVPGFMIGANNKIKAKKWAMKYSQRIPHFLYYTDSGH